jgi:hypothetical protein
MNDRENDPKSMQGQENVPEFSESTFDQESEHLIVVDEDMGRYGGRIEPTNCGTDYNISCGKTNNAYCWLTVLAFLVAVGSICWQSYRMQVMITDVSALKSSNMQLNEKLSKSDTERDSMIRSIYAKVKKQRDDLDHYTKNITTNNDLEQWVVDTRDQLEHQMDSMRTDMKTFLKQEEEELEDRVDARIQSISDTVSATEARVKDAERAVDRKIINIKQALNQTSEQIGDAVLQAKSQIHMEVKTVRENVDQYVSVTNNQFRAENDFVKYQLAGTFTLIACLISFWHITSHLRNLHKPYVQRRIAAILWMVPIYSVTSWLSLVFPYLEPTLSVVRNLYEAYVIYTFIGFLVAILEDGKGLQGLVEKMTKRVEEERESIQLALQTGERPPSPRLSPPFSCCHTEDASSVAVAWLYQCKMMALQFVLLKPVLVVLPIALGCIPGVDMNVPTITHHRVNWDSPALYINMLQCVAVSVAFYGLLLFYHGSDKELEWCNPWPKFLCIKAVVFMTFWQEIGLQAMSALKVVDEHSAGQFQNLFVCLEMLLASAAHFYIFPHEEWADGYRKEKERSLGVRDTLALKVDPSTLSHNTQQSESFPSRRINVKFLIQELGP